MKGLILTKMEMAFESIEIRLEVRDGEMVRVLIIDTQSPADVHLADRKTHPLQALRQVVDPVAEGHEIGHVALQHTLKAYKNALITSAAVDAIASAGDVAAILSDSILGQLGQSMVNARFSRSQETAADDFGYDFLKARGVNPWYMGTAFGKLLGESQGSSSQQSRVAEMFSSHPDTQSRINRVAEKATADGFKKP